MREQETKSSYSMEILDVIFERMESYFKSEKPFLSSELNIIDISKTLYTNKTYVSRAVRECSGLNFCGYVNYHRIVYSMQLFEKNTDLKINEMAHMSGFHSIATFNISFRKVVQLSPTEWCNIIRAEKRCDDRYLSEP